MKKTKFSIIALSALLFCVGLFTIYSCNKDVSPGQCGTPGTQLAAKIHSQVTFPNKVTSTVSFMDKDEYKNRPDACVYAWAEESYSPNQMVQLLNSFGIMQINNQQNLLGIIAYYGNDKKDYVLNNDLVYGFLVLTNDDKGYMYTQVFQKNGNKFEHLPKFDSKIWKLLMTERNDLAKILAGRNNDLGYAVRIVNRQSTYKPAVRGTRANNFQHQIDAELKGLTTLEYSTHIMRKFTEPEHAGNKTCSLQECKVTGKGRCADAFPSETPFCDEDKTIGETCGGKIAYQVAEMTNLDVMNATVNFRDNILSQSSYGIHFTEDLEYVGYIFTQHLSMSDALDIVDVMDHVIYPLAQKLNNPDAMNDNTAFMTTAQATALHNIITQIRALSTDGLYNEILDEMSANVTYVQGMTTAQVYHELIPS
ncbi:hypothetical protein [Edaphocola flava]|uniref:hypothetical protein n=1 Tax=Edaphocola flava TaxID=2499629 RepID=UPI00100B5F61|nr:hypothetical protein [Edaphocola flava]